MRGSRSFFTPGRFMGRQALLHARLNDAVTIGRGGAVGTGSISIFSSAVSGRICILTWALCYCLRKTPTRARAAGYWRSRPLELIGFFDVSRNWKARTARISSHLTPGRRSIAPSSLAPPSACPAIELPRPRRRERRRIARVAPGKRGAVYIAREPRIRLQADR